MNSLGFNFLQGRIIDTRESGLNPLGHWSGLDGPGKFLIPICTQGWNPAGIPPEAKGVRLHVTVLPLVAGNGGYASAFATSVFDTNTSFLNFPDGKVTSGGADVELASGNGITFGQVGLKLSQPAHLIVDLVGYYSHL